MGFLNQLEKLSEKLIEGFFKSKFKGHIQPIEIAKKLAKEMGSKKTVTISRVYVPNEYTVQVSGLDWENIAVFQEEVVAELQQYLAVKAKEKHYAMATSPVVKFEVKEDLGIGIFEVLSRFVEPPEGMPKGFQLEEEEPVREPLADHTQVFEPGPGFAQFLSPKPGEARAELVMLEGHDPGMTFRLGHHRMVLGRRETNHIFLDDENVSRRHAQLDYLKDGFYITDLASLNGTYVNGERIEKHRLQGGDRISLGSTELEFRMV